MQASSGKTPVGADDPVRPVKSFAEFAARRRRTIQIVFRRGVYVAKNTLRGESVQQHKMCAAECGSERILIWQKKRQLFASEIKRGRVLHQNAAQAGGILESFRVLWYTICPRLVHRSFCRFSAHSRKVRRNAQNLFHFCELYINLL